MSETIETVARYIALTVPATVAITTVAKLALEWLNQRHSLKTSRIEQAHQITSHYLNKALDPNIPLAIRYQLLRFLATSEKDGSRLSDWARSELERVEIAVEETNQAVSVAEKELLAAKTPSEVQTAEKKLAFATTKRRSLLEPAKMPPVTPAALRAGLIENKELAGLTLKNSDLRGMSLQYRNLQGADFSGCVISDGNFQGSDLRGACFKKCDLSEAKFFESDLRAADFTESNLAHARFTKARLESADFTGATIENVDFKATFDVNTKWPRGFDPDANGAVRIPN